MSPHSQSYALSTVRMSFFNSAGFNSLPEGEESCPSFFLPNSYWLVGDELVKAWWECHLGLQCQDQGKLIKRCLSSFPKVGALGITSCPEAMSPLDEVPWLRELWPQLCQLIKDTFYHKVTFVLMQIVIDTGQPVLLCSNCWDIYHLRCEFLEMQAGNHIYFHDFNRLPTTRSVIFQDLSPSFHCNHRFLGIHCHTWHIVRCSINAC